MLPTPEQIQRYIADGLPCDHVEVEGQRLIKRHQLVYGALGDRMRAEIHALSMKTLTPAEWQNK